MSRETMCIRKARLLIGTHGAGLSSVEDDLATKDGTVTAWCGESFVPNEHRGIVVSVDAALTQPNVSLCPTCVTAITVALDLIR